MSARTPDEISWFYFSILDFQISKWPLLANSSFPPNPSNASYSQIRFVWQLNDCHVW